MATDEEVRKLLEECDEVLNDGTMTIAGVRMSKRAYELGEDRGREAVARGLAELDAYEPATGTEMNERKDLT